MLYGSIFVGIALGGYFNKLIDSAFLGEIAGHGAP
jgi:hypothetical protein